MRHVFVETNWVVEFAAPAHLRTAAAVQLLEQSRHGELRLHLPAVCLTEARNPIRIRYQPRSSAASVRKYVHWVASTGKIDPARAEVAYSVLDQYVGAVSAELDALDGLFNALTQDPAIEVFGLSNRMLARAVQLAATHLELKPFDQTILAAVLTRAEELREEGADDIAFCELDGDLQPWDKNGNDKQPLASLYDSAHIWVYGDFELTAPPKPPDLLSQASDLFWSRPIRSAKNAPTEYVREGKKTISPIAPKQSPSHPGFTPKALITRN